MAHIHNVLDTNLHFVIDPLTRQLRIDTEVEKESKMVVIQYDHNSERVTFEIPKEVDGHDMSLCNVVQVHYLNVSTDGRSTASGVYEVEDLQVSGDVVVGTWLISQNATQLAGTLNFLIRFVCVTGDFPDYVWNTSVYQSIAVSSGLYNGEAVVAEYADILEQWRRDLIENGGWKIDNLTEETDLADDDSVPFYDTSATDKRKTLWSNIKAKLKSYFDTLYKAIATKETDPTVFDWAKKELFNKANFIDPANRNTFVTIDGVEYYRYHCSADNFEWYNPRPLPGSVTITIRTMSQYTSGVSGIILHYGDGMTEVIYPEKGVTTIYTTDEKKTFVKMTGRYDLENWNLIDMSVMSIVANYNIGIPLANAHAAGGFIADSATLTDTQPVRIGKDGKLYTSPVNSEGENIGDLYGCTFEAEVVCDGVTSAYEFSTDAEGNSLSLDEIVIKITHADTSGYQRIYVNDVSVSYRHSKSNYDETIRILRIGNRLWGIGVHETGGANDISGMSPSVSAGGLTGDILNGRKIEKISVRAAYPEGTVIKVFGR